MSSRLSAFLTAAALACLTSVAGAQAKPATVTCNDGTTSTATGRGACSSHGGVKKAETSKSESKPATTAAKPKTTGKTAGKTAMVKCTDGTMSKGGQGACSSHGGIAKPK